ncbi:response regulator [Indioceanicola profundi]|uniref:response regulator n=1 Tax=Indioceanicola profundi TaxID=2220096 RepID=UPI001CEDEF26|nr:response regulator [Indioceanicola profundi]
MTDRVEPILLVEDDPNDQLLIRRAFGKAKLMNPLSVVGDGDEAVAYLSGMGGNAGPPALIMLDLKLPRRSGLEVLEWLRAQPAPLGRTPVVVLTSSRENHDVARAYELGANSYLVKPVDFDGLLEMIKTAGLYWTVLNEGPARQ